MTSPSRRILGCLLLAACGPGHLPEKTQRPAVILQHPFRPAAVVSCYTTNLGSWNPPLRGPGSEFWEIPQTVRLTNTPLEGFVGWFKIEPVVYDESITRRWGSWELQGNALRVLWLALWRA